MQYAPHISARRRTRLGMAVGLLAGLLLLPPGPSLAAGSPTGARDLIGAWITRLDQRATELEAAPPVKATRVGAGSVLKLGDGGMVEVPVPDPAATPAPPAQPGPTADSAGTPATDTPSANTPASDTPAATPSAPPVVAEAPVLDIPLPPVMAVRSRNADRVARLASRLIELGYLPADAWSDAFDERIEAGVRAFQLAEGLMPDGKVGEVTRQALDRTPRQAAALMRNAATALRQFQPTVPDTVLLVNLPSQTVTYIEHGKQVFAMRAVVGRPSRQTPLLKDRVTSVTVNPTWTVPPTVMSEDKLPILRKKGNPGIKDAIVYLDGAEVAPESVNWWSVTPDRIRIVQRPGDGNALGRFRFNLTNGEGIFLHGTNDPRLFDRDLRAASSGCVRLADARLAAETFLRAAKIDSTAIEAQLASGQTRTIGLPKPVAVRFVYWTATVEGDGTVRVHPGIYDDVPAAGASSAPPTPAPIPAATPAGRKGEPKAADTRGRVLVAPHDKPT